MGRREGAEGVGKRRSEMNSFNFLIGRKLFFGRRRGNRSGESGYLMTSAG